MFADEASDVAFFVTSPIAGNGKSDDIIVRAVVAIDILGSESQSFGFHLTQIDQETRVYDDDPVATFVFTLADWLVLVSSSIIVIETHAAPVIRVQAQRVEHGRDNRVIRVDHRLQCLVVCQENIAIYKLQLKGVSNHLTTKQNFTLMRYVKSLIEFVNVNQAIYPNKIRPQFSPFIQSFFPQTDYVLESLLSPICRDFIVGYGRGGSQFVINVMI